MREDVEQTYVEPFVVATPVIKQKMSIDLPSISP